MLQCIWTLLCSLTSLLMKAIWNTKIYITFFNQKDYKSYNELVGTWLNLDSRNFLYLRRLNAFSLSELWGIWCLLCALESITEISLFRRLDLASVFETSKNKKYKGYPATNDHDVVNFAFFFIFFMRNRMRYIFIICRFSLHHRLKMFFTSGYLL